MPKFSASRHVSHPDGKKIKRTKHRGHQYRDAVKARKLRKTRIKGIVEEVVESVEPGKPKPLKRAPKYDFARIERKIRASREESQQPVNIPVIPAEVYGANPVNDNVPRVIIPTSEATAKRKQAAAADDGDATDVDDSEDVVVVPAGFVEAAEKLGLLNASAASSGPHEVFEVFEEPSSTSQAQPDEELSRVESPSTEIKTPSPPAAPEVIPPAPSPSSSTQPSHLVPEPVSVETVYNDRQTTAATKSPTDPDPEPSEPNVPISVPQAPSIPESFQEAAWSSVTQHQDPTFWNNNMDGVHIHQQDIPNAFYFGSTSDDINMELSGAFMMETPVYSLPTTWISPQLQPEHQTFYSYVGQIADNSSYYQTYAMNNIHPDWASVQFQPVQNEPIQQSAQINQPPFNHAADPLTAASCFWTALGGNPGTSQPPTTVAKTTKSIPAQVDEQPQEEPTKPSLLIRQDGYLDRRRCRLDNSYNRGVHPFPGLRGYKNMRLINMSRELEESRIVLPRPAHRRHLMESPVGSEMDLVNRLNIEAEGHSAPQIKMKHRKRQREEFQPDFACTSESDSDIKVPPRQRRRCGRKVKIPIPAQKRSHKLHQRCVASLEGPTLTSSRTSTGWNFSRFCPSISSLTDRLFKFF